MIWFGLVLWYIKYCKSFNAKSCLYVRIKYMISKHILWITVLNEQLLIFFSHLNGFINFYLIRIILFTINQSGLCLHGVMFKALDFRIVVSEFELQSCYYVHFRTNTFGKGMKLLILPAMG